MRRWPRLVQTLGVSEEKALEIIKTDSTPLLVESEAVAEVLSRLAAISSKEKALDLVGLNPALLAGASDLKEGKGFGVSAIIDILYAGRLRKVFEDGARDNEGKLAEIELYTYAMASCKPILDVFQGGRSQEADCHQLIRKPLQIAAQVVPNRSIRVFFSRLAAAPDPFKFLAGQTGVGLNIAGNLASRPALATTFLPHSPAILPHLPGIYARLSILEPHVPGIVRILDPYLEIVEPHLDRIMERMDKIEPHLPYILLHLDVLAKHCGKLLDHFDELMPFAEQSPYTDRNLEDWRACYASSKGNPERIQMESCMIDRWQEEDKEEVERAQHQTSYLPQLMRYVDFVVPRLDKLAPHLPLIRPHMPYIIPYLDKILPYIDGFAALPLASANADVLIGYLGWMLRVPLLPKVLHIPFVPRIIAAASKILPRWPIRGQLEKKRRKYEAAQRLALQNVASN